MEETVESAGRISNFEPLIDSEHAAALLGGVHVKTVQKLARMGQIPAHPICGRWYFRASELDEWVRSQVNSNRHPCRVN